MADFKFFSNILEDTFGSSKIDKQTFGEHVYYAYRVEPTTVNNIPSFKVSYQVSYAPKDHKNIQDVTGRFAKVVSDDQIGINDILEAEGIKLASGEVYKYNTYHRTNLIPYLIKEIRKQLPTISEQLAAQPPYSIDWDAETEIAKVKMFEDSVVDTRDYSTNDGKPSNSDEEYTRVVTFTIPQQVSFAFPDPDKLLFSDMSANVYESFVQTVMTVAKAAKKNPTEETAKAFLAKHFPELTKQNLKPAWAYSQIQESNNDGSTARRFQIPSTFVRGMILEKQLTDYIRNNFGSTDPVDPTVPVEDRDKKAREQRQKNQEEADRIAKLRSKVKLTEQAFLLKNLKHFTKKAIGFREAFPYDNFACLDTKEQNSISDFVTLVTTQNNMAGLFERLKPIHISSMLPIVKVYGYEDKRRDRVYEYQFEEFSRFSAGEDLLGTSTGVNMTSFSWNFRGETPFLADKKIDCQMTLRAQSVDALVASKFSKGIEYSFSNLFLPVQPKETKNGRSIGETDSEVRKMRARAIVSYSIDRDSAPWKSDKALADMVEAMTVELELSLTSHSIDLNQDGTMKVNINFIGRYDAEVKEPDSSNILSRAGTPEENTDFQHGMSFQYGTTNADGSTQFDGQSLVPEKELKIRELRNKIASLEGQGGYQEKVRESLKEALKTLEGPEASAPKKETNEFDRKRGVLNLMRKIYEKRGIKIARFDLENLEVIAATKEEVETEQSKPGRGTGQSVEESMPTEEEMPENPLQTISDLKQSLRRDVDLFINKMDGYLSQYINVKYLFLGDILEAALESYAENADSSSHDKHVRDLRVILGPMEFISGYYDSSTGQGFTPTYNGETGDFDNPELLSKCQALQEKKKKGKLNDSQEKQLKACQEALRNIKPTKVVCNIADIPVSVNLFNSWLTENILDEGKTKMTFDDFIKSITSRLIPQLIRHEAENILLPRVNSKVFDSVHSAPTDVTAPFADGVGFVMEKNEKSKTDTPMWKPFREGFISSREKKRVYIEELKSGKNPGIPLPNRAAFPGAHMADYLMIYGEPLSQTKAFDKKRDNAQGIYHLQVGQDAGVVKEINLSVVEDQSFESFVIQKALQNGNNVRKRFYDAKVDMQGVTFFRPGQKVFINPAAFGRQEDLKSFGLLAYYTVITSENIIEDGQYKTSLDCKFHAYPDTEGDK